MLEKFKNILSKVLIVLEDDDIMNELWKIDIDQIDTHMSIGNQLLGQYTSDRGK